MLWFASADDDMGNNNALVGTQKIDNTFKKASNCLFQLYKALCLTEDPTEVKEILCGHESQISELEQINIEADSDHLYLVNTVICEIQRSINYHSH